VIKLYGVPASRASRSLWMLEELGVEYENVPISFAGEAQKPDFLKINPNGKIPALDDGGTVLFESMAINLYLAEKYGRGTLWPASVADHGRCYQWSVWAMTEGEPPAMSVLLNRAFLPADQRDEAEARAGEEALAKPLGVLDAALEGRPWLLGDAFTVADLNVAGVVSWLPLLGRMDLSRWRNAKRWNEACIGRPAYRKLRGT
jgi:glutathione S-transferase